MRSTLIATLLTCAGLAIASPATACDDAKVKVVSAGSADSGGATATVTSADGKTVIVCKGERASTFTINKSGEVNVVSAAEGADGERKIVLVSPEGKREISSKAKAFKVVIEGDGEPQVIELSPEEIAEHGIISAAPDAPHTFRFSEPKEGRPGVRVFGGEGGRAFAFAAPKGEARGFMRAAPSDEAAPAPDRPRLGVMLDESEDGLIIHNVMDGMPASKSGLQQGDLIVEINGAGPANMDRLRKALGASEISMTVVRDGEENEIKVKLGGGESGEAPRWRMRGDANVAPAPAPRWERRGGAGQGGAEAPQWRMRGDEDALKERIIIRERAQAGDREEALRKRLEGMQGRFRSFNFDEKAMVELRQGLEEAQQALGNLKIELDLDLDAETLVHVQKALKEAMANVEIQIDGNVRKAIEEAQVKLRQIEPGRLRAIMPRSDREGAHWQGWVEREHAKDAPRHAQERRREVEVEVRERAMAEAQRHREQAQQHRREVIRERLGEDGENANRDRNRDLDARLKSLEERMERIEAMLRRLDRQG